MINSSLREVKGEIVDLVEPTNSKDENDRKFGKVKSVQVTELSPSDSETVASLGLRIDEDGVLKWKSNSSDHPRNWSFRRKFFDTTLLFMFDLFTTAVSTTGPEVAATARHEYGLSRTQSLVVFSSMYQFGQAAGGVVFPPYSEAFGRKSVYVTSALLYCAACIVVAAIPHVAGAAIGRFVSGVMSAVPSVVVSGSVEDMFNVKDRIWMMFLWASATTLGILLGPIYGSYVSVYLGWRWVFYVAAIVTASFAVLLCFMKESRPSLLLSRKLTYLQNVTGLSDLRIQNPDHTLNLQTFTKTALIRPTLLFFSEPIVFLVSIMSAVGWALIYLFTESLPIVYQEFGLTREQSSLMFLAIAIGILICIIPRLYDDRLVSKRYASNKLLRPEEKLMGFMFAAPSLACGLWWLVLTTPPASTLPWYSTILGLILIGFATNEFVCTLSGYLADTYTIYTSSATAALAFLRAILAGLFPLMGTPMYKSLGTNWATVILASVATLFCVTPILFRIYGARIRQRSEFAKYSFRVNRETQIEDDSIDPV